MRHDSEFDGRLFPFWAGERSPLALRRVSSKLSRQFERIFVAAGCANLGFHDLRHEATSILYEKTTLTDIKIASITGHRDPRQLKRYANLRARDLADQLW
ncbi:tyrosine-type recombinase/integrase [Stenotrophomonas maltophilia]|uniref:tyrosine-type recombinase/integrase n=1 Tax=Stenotrophomonas maltophilia TaxID=40324 RepID=UPI003CCFF524